MDCGALVCGGRLALAFPLPLPLSSSLLAPEELLSSLSKLKPKELLPRLKPELSELSPLLLLLLLVVLVLLVVLLVVPLPLDGFWDDCMDVILDAS